MRSDSHSGIDAENDEDEEDLPESTKDHRYIKQTQDEPVSDDDEEDEHGDDGEEEESGLSSVQLFKSSDKATTSSVKQQKRSKDETPRAAAER